MSKIDWTTITITRKTRDKLNKIREVHDLSWDQLLQELLEK